jgi:RNA-splicing ligase RtcB
VKIIKGQFNEAIVYTNNIEEKACQQIRELCNQEFAKESRIRIMPDTHAGAGCGSIIATGKGNAEWNESAPHGAGRLLSRSQAKKSLTMEGFTKSMAGIYTTSLSRDTLDEAPSAYKPMAEIIANIQETVEINKIIKPIYNFKASGD